MLTDLFKPAWKSSSVDKRLNAVTTMNSDNDEQQNILIQLANNDSDESICTVAIKKIKSVSVVHEMSLKHSKETMRAVASNRLNDLMSSGLDSEEFDKLLKASPELRIRVAANADSDVVRNKILHELSTDELLEVLAETIYTDSRQQIADKFSDLNTLEAARKILRGKDKNAERIIKTKIDEFKGLERQKAENLEIVNELIEEVEYLSSRDDWLPEFMSRSLAHCNRWDGLNLGIEAELKSRYQKARTILDKQYQERLIIKEAKQSQQKTIDELQALLKNVGKRDLKTSIESVSDVNEKRNQLIAEWKSLAEKHTPEKELKEQFVKMTVSLESVTHVLKDIMPLFAEKVISKQVFIEEKPSEAEKDQVSIEASSEEAINKDITSKEAVNKEVISEEMTSEEVVNKEITSGEVTGEEVVNKEVISEEAISEEAISKEAISKEAISKKVTSDVTDVDNNTQDKSIEAKTTEAEDTEIETSKNDSADNEKEQSNTKQDKKIEKKLPVKASTKQPIQSLNKSINKLQWQSSYGVLKLKVELQQKLFEWKKSQKDEAETHERQLTAAHKNISSIFHFARVGNLTRAKQMCMRVEKSLNKFTGKDHAAMKVRYEEAFDQLGDMGDWKSFATEPKYVELCDAMEQLIGSKIHPDKLFQDMQAVQQQWKALGSSDISEQYWPRFKEAADKVYQPCEVFFEERKVLRKNNLEKRQQQVVEMKELAEQTDWENKPDYKGVESSVRSINSRFVAIKDVEHKAGRKQWTQFSKFKDQVFGKLDVIYDENIESKQQLIKLTETLAQAEVKEDNLDALKTLQHRWKQVGLTRRKDDQKAWKMFKKYGDEVYNQVQGVRQGVRDENDQQINAYRDITKSIKELAKKATELSEADHQFSALQASYAELPKLPEKLPEKLIEGIQRDYQNACSQFDECHDRIINNIRKGQLDALRQKSELCSQLESLFAKGEPDQKKLEEIEKQWDEIQLEDREFEKRIETRRKSVETDVDRKEITKKRRMMCIKLEIAKGTETPAEDKSERMQFQLDQMNQSGLGLQGLSNADQLNDFQLDWLCMPGADPKQQTVLDKRFWLAFDS